MINFLTKLLKHPFFAGSLVMVLGSNIYNLGQFIYHFLAGRILGKVYYGDLASIISILSLFAIIQASLGLTVIKYIASQKNPQRVNNFISWVYWISLWIGLGLVGAVFISAPSLSHFLNLSTVSVYYMLAPILFFYLMTSSGRSILQGLLKFEKYVVSLLVESVVKVGLILALPTLLWALFGAMFSLLLGIVGSFVIITIWLWPYLRVKKMTTPKLLPLFKYSSAAFIQGFALTSMYSTDLLLVKHFFPPDQASIYASSAVLGRIVFFGISPITQVMFPLVAKRYHQALSYRIILYLSLILTLAISFLVIFIYQFFPALIIGITFGPNFIEGAPILVWFAIFMALLALAMMLTQFYLSTNKLRVIWLFVLAALLQILLILFIHPSLLAVIQVSSLAAALLVLALFVYFFYSLR